MLNATVADAFALRNPVAHQANNVRANIDELRDEPSDVCLSVPAQLTASIFSDTPGTPHPDLRVSRKLHRSFEETELVASIVAAAS